MEARRRSDPVSWVRHTAVGVIDSRLDLGPLAYCAAEQFVKFALLSLCLIWITAMSNNRHSAPPTKPHGQKSAPGSEGTQSDEEILRRMLNTPPKPHTPPKPKRPRKIEASKGSTRKP